jgi:hypothetical protein
MSKSTQVKKRKKQLLVIIDQVLQSGTNRDAWKDGMEQSCWNWKQFS